MMVSVKVKRETLVPVLAFHIVMELAPTMAARRSRQESWGAAGGEEEIRAERY